MSYIDDYYSSDDDDYQDIYYHNYSVDYANQILNGQFNVSSRLPFKSKRYSPKLLRVATLDNMPLRQIRQTNVPHLHSIPKFGQQQQSPPQPLPSLEETSQELERRANRTIQPDPPINNQVPSSDQHQTMTEQQLRQVQQQQQAFQQHLVNMQNHLLEQQQQPTPNRTNRFEKKTKTTYHSFDRDDDQDEIAQLIETDPYFAAAMEDFAFTHGLINHRTHSDSSSDHSQDSPSSSSSSSSSSLTNVTSNTKSSKNESMLYRELHEIRRLIEDYVNNRQRFYPQGMETDHHHQSQINPKRPPPNPNAVLYQNVVDVVKQVMDRRSPSQHDLPLKPSQIDPSLKHNYTKRPIIPPPPPLFPNPSLPNIDRRRSSQLSTPPLSNNIPPPPPYENLANFRSTRPTISANGNLSYGNYPRQLYFSKPFF